uniref:Post-GPI attachment to proteins factor 3 n=1 Tax=Globodera pallida TaxID=36090 RepID=A0A183C5G1_GLOPA
MTRKQQRLARKRGKKLKEFNRLIRAAEGGEYNKSRICFHEAGHCFNVWFQAEGGRLCDVTCVQNGTIDGLTRHWSRRPATRASLRAEIAIKMGGKAAEMLMFDASLGHYADQPEWERKAKAFLLGWSSAAFDVFFDFPPLFWIVDAHALFHLVSIPVPLLWAKFICAEADAAQQKIKERIY